MKAEPHHLVALIAAAIAALFLLIHVVGIERRNAQYRATLKTYSDVLKPGMKRSEVENYFVVSKHVSFDQRTSEDIVHLAHEREGWFCKEQLIYLTFEFAAVEPKKELVAEPGDTLVRMSLERSLCLDLP